MWPASPRFPVRTTGVGCFPGRTGLGGRDGKPGVAVSWVPPEPASPSSPGPPVRIALLLVLGFPVGWLVVDWMRQPFTDRKGLMKEWFGEQPVTVIAACTIVGSVVVWGVLSLVGVW